MSEAQRAAKSGWLVTVERGTTIRTWGPEVLDTRLADNPSRTAYLIIFQMLKLISCLELDVLWHQNCPLYRYRGASAFGQ